MSNTPTCLFLLMATWTLGGLHPLLQVTHPHMGVGSDTGPTSNSHSALYPPGGFTGPRTLPKPTAGLPEAWGPTWTSGPAGSAPQPHPSISTAFQRSCSLFPKLRPHSCPCWLCGDWEGALRSQGRAGLGLEASPQSRSGDRAGPLSATRTHEMGLNQRSGFTADLERSCWSGQPRNQLCERTMGGFPGHFHGSFYDSVGGTWGAEPSTALALFESAACWPWWPGASGIGDARAWQGSTSQVRPAEGTQAGMRTDDDKGGGRKA